MKLTPKTHKNHEQCMEFFDFLNTFDCMVNVKKTLSLFSAYLIISVSLTLIHTAVFMLMFFRLTINMMKGTHHQYYTSYILLATSRCTL